MRSALLCRRVKSPLVAAVAFVVGIAAGGVLVGCLYALWSMAR